jgi:hypothetical protein
MTMASADRFARDDRIPAGAAMHERAAGDLSNESDDSSERARLFYYYPSADPSGQGVKRGGNNHFGSTGILKCLTCRKRKGKVYIT